MRMPSTSTINVLGAKSRELDWRDWTGQLAGPPLSVYKTVSLAVHTALG